MRRNRNMPRREYDLENILLFGKRMNAKRASMSTADFSLWRAMYIPEAGNRMFEKFLILAGNELKVRAVYKVKPYMSIDGMLRELGYEPESV